MKSNLELNRQIYEIAIKYVLSESNYKDDEYILKKIERISKHAAFNFNGLLSDSRLETILNNIGGNIPSFPKKRFIYRERLNILHIATTLLNVGGHTRVIRNWLEQDKINSNILAVVNQEMELDFHLKKDFESFCKIEKIDSKLNYLAKANELRCIVERNDIDMIVLHIHPFDVISVVALSTLSMPPVIFYNHADHIFSLGVSVSDAFIDFREKGKEFSLNNRGVSKSYVLPYPLGSLDLSISKKSARQKLLLNDNDVVLVTMASSYKYKPVDNLNFFELYSEFLVKNPAIKFYAIGVALNDYNEFTEGRLKPDNLFLLGNVVDPRLYLAASDYFIEPFPFGTGLGLFDAVQYRSFPIFSNNDYSIYGEGASSMFPIDVCEYKNDIYFDFYRAISQEIETGFLKKKYAEKIDFFIKKCEHPEWVKFLYCIYDDLVYSDHKITSFDNKELTGKCANNASIIYNYKLYYFTEKFFILQDVRLNLSEKAFVLYEFFRGVLNSRRLSLMCYLKKNSWLLKSIVMPKTI